MNASRRLTARHPLHDQAHGSATPRDLLRSTVLLVLFSGVYLTGLVQLAHASVWVEAFFALALPLWICTSPLARLQHPRLLQLVAIESAFNGLAVTSRIAHLYDLPTLNTWLGGALIGWAVVQLGGFILGHIRHRSWFAFTNTSLFLVLIFTWVSQAPALGSVPEADGSLQVWGGPAPTVIWVYYAFWFMGFLFTDTDALPLVRQQIAHAVSIALSVASGAFFHTRLMTACHLFVLDVAFAYSSDPAVFGDRFAVLPPRWLQWLEAGGAKRISAASTVGCVTLAAYGLLGGGIAPLH